MSTIETILSQMSSVAKPQRQFLLTLFNALMYLPSRVNFRNLGRYSDCHEKTFSRWFSRSFDFLAFNLLILQDVLHGKGERIAAIDASFVPKSGRKSYGLDWFWNGSQGQAQRGQELSLLALVDVTHNTAYTLSARQTPTLPRSTRKGQSQPANTKDKTKVKHPPFVGAPLPTRMDSYLGQLQHAITVLLGCGIRYLVADSFYAKTKFVSGIRELNLHLISKLRQDADLRWLYTGAQKPKGRHRQYSGKVSFDDLSRFERVGELDGQRVYTATVNSPTFKQIVRIVYLVREANGKTASALLFSTDTDCPALDILRYYQARFQIEFLFRDAKQHTGLCDCQTTRKEKLDFHFNTSLTALNLLRLEDRQQNWDAGGNGRSVLSVASGKIRHFNAHLLERFSRHLKLDFSAIKSSPAFADLCNYGAIAA
ncbi:MAG: transposase [Thiofilum sp.]|uniref:transposase n=1 Tax=Thiofilum sp. TaxID=2212733 RepID=UPI0025F7F165|nr:transposase [Thiofilum sp.]MBK8451735.1 transposase [Thiofilum sp.]MBK8452875.1 transposase [Thiofilum sp.]